MTKPAATSTDIKHTTKRPKIINLVDITSLTVHTKNINESDDKYNIHPSFSISAPSSSGSHS
jgi:hypothetical protein